MKSLVFCTSYANSASDWELRYRLWIRSLITSSLHFDQLLIVDDASSVLPDWTDIEILHEAEASPVAAVRSDSRIVLYNHTKHLGRQSVFEFPGWYRSFAFGVHYGLANGFEKIIHIESDAHLLSSRIRNFINNVSDDWIAFWCQKYNMPEIAIQVCAGSHLATMAQFVSHPYEKMSGQNHELQFPFSHIEKGFKGDRYGEEIGSKVPRNADYCSQTLSNMEESEYWWLDQSTQSLLREFHAPFEDFDFKTGWATPDASFRWMEGFESLMLMPGIDISEFNSIEFSVSPCLFADRKIQRLFVVINGVFVREAAVTRDAMIRCAVSQLPSGAALSIRFIHPDAFSPSEVGGHPETRMLSFALSAVRMKRGDDESGISVRRSGRLEPRDLATEHERSI